MFLAPHAVLTPRRQSISLLDAQFMERNTGGTCLGRKVEAQKTAPGQAVLHQQRHLVGEADLDLVGEHGGLAEVDEILEGESQVDGLGQLNVDVELGLVDVGVAAQGDGAIADVAQARELDPVFARLDGNCAPLVSPTQSSNPPEQERLTRLGHGDQVTADAAELGCWHRNGGRVLGFGDAQVLLVNVHQLEVVLADAVVLAALEDQVQAVGRVLGLERQDILVLRRAQHLGQRRQVDA